MSSRPLRVITSLFILSSAATFAGDLTILWDPSPPDPDLTGYRVYVSSESGVFSLTPEEARSVATVQELPATALQTVVTGLDGDTIYWVGVTAFDAAGNESIFSNIVSGRPSDLVLPDVSMTSPSEAAVLMGTVPLEASASDNRGVARVVFFVDDVEIGAPVTTPPWSIPWDTWSVEEGVHELTAIAFDAADNARRSPPVTIVVHNGTPLDLDADGILDAVDNCPMIKNPRQENSDQDAEGGDACDLTIVSPAIGEASCPGPAPTVRWTRESYRRFRVSVSANSDFSNRAMSGWWLLTENEWQIPQEDWNRLCDQARPNLYFKVLGRNFMTGTYEVSDVHTLTVR